MIDVIIATLWKGDRAVDCGSLENCCACKRTEGSNPSSSASHLFLSILFCIQLSIELLKFQCIMILVGFDESIKNCSKLSLKRGTLGGTFLIIK